MLLKILRHLFSIFSDRSNPVSPNNPVCNQLVVYGDDALVFPVLHDQSVHIDEFGVRLIKVENFAR
ncbi:unnamed protein product [Brugia pahangi]|uniref:Reverse transcriptase domain-containing protein n=1 Tax=Brugia pahangi TaxID=6280 RepID=A0A0N4TLI5_BRUPA|nr:unnamed protein product [Brugia pahangi]